MIAPYTASSSSVTAVVAQALTTSSSSSSTTTSSNANFHFIEPPPFMLGERPNSTCSSSITSSGFTTNSNSASGTGPGLLTSGHRIFGGKCKSTSKPSAMLSFHQVPFVRVSQRVESGVKVRKHLRKYLRASSSTQQMVAQMHLNDACLSAMHPEEIPHSCFQNFFRLMKNYNETIGQKHLEASKAFQEMTNPLKQSGKSRKWAREVYNLVQKSVLEVNSLEKKMEKALLRKDNASRNFVHWEKVLAANEATFLVQPNNPDVVRSFELTKAKFTSAKQELLTSTKEYDSLQCNLFASIEKRDEIVEEATQFSQFIEEDRLDTMLIVMRQFVETKVNILNAEIEAMSEMQQILKQMDRESVIQQYIMDSMQPELTHRHAKALYLLEWQRLWHLEQQQQQKQTQEPSNWIAIETSEDHSKLKNLGLSRNDVEVIKHFVFGCFVEPAIKPGATQTAATTDTSTASSDVPNAVAAATTTPVAAAPTSSSAKYRRNFLDDSLGKTLYRKPYVRKIFLACLHFQRTVQVELTPQGYEDLCKALHLLLDASQEQNDVKRIKDVMNLAQTFYVPSINHSSSKRSDKEHSESPRSPDLSSMKFVQKAIGDHPVWRVAAFWGTALLLSIAEELTKMPQEVPWYHLDPHERTQLVLQTHALVFGQVSSFIVNMSTFAKSALTRKTMMQYVEHICLAYELAEDQRIALLSTVNGLKLGSKRSKRKNNNSCASIDGSRNTNNNESLTLCPASPPIGGAGEEGEVDPSEEDSGSSSMDFSGMTLMDWTRQLGGNCSHEVALRFQSLAERRYSTASNASTTRITDTCSSVGGDTPRNLTSSASVVSNSNSSVCSEPSSVSTYGGAGAASVAGSQASTVVEEEAWEQLFGSGATGPTGGSKAAFGSSAFDDDDGTHDGGAAASFLMEEDKPKEKKKKRPKSSRQFNDQLRMARSIPLSQRIHDDKNKDKDKDKDKGSSPSTPSPSSSATPVVSTSSSMPSPSDHAFRGPTPVSGASAPPKVAVSVAGVAGVARHQEKNQVEKMTMPSPVNSSSPSAATPPGSHKKKKKKSAPKSASAIAVSFPVDATEAVTRGRSASVKNLAQSVQDLQVTATGAGVELNQQQYALQEQSREQEAPDPHQVPVRTPPSGAKPIHGQDSMQAAMNLAAQMAKRRTETTFASTSAKMSSSCARSEDSTSDSSGVAALRARFEAQQQR